MENHTTELFQNSINARKVTEPLKVLSIMVKIYQTHLKHPFPRNHLLSCSHKQRAFLFLSLV